MGDFCKIFISVHKESYIPKNKYFVPIHVGAANSKLKLKITRDDSGDNISRFNKHFCELTAQYWAWKNCDAEFYGFMHYRRFFAFKDTKLKYNNERRQSITNDVLKEFNINESGIKSAISDCDIILPLHENLTSAARFQNNLIKQYKTSPLHNVEDYIRALEIIKELHPNFTKYIKQANKAITVYFYNMFIMRKQYFQEYCEWLFPILLKLNSEKKYDGESIYAQRMIGFVGERLLSIFMYYLRDKYKNLRIKEYPTIFFPNTDCPYLVPKYKNKIGICFISGNDYVKHLLVTLISLVDNSSPSNNYDIIILDNFLSLFNKDLITSVVEKHNNFCLRFVPVGDYLRNKKLFTKNGISTNTYLRFAIPDLLYNYEKIIYLDSDIILNSDIAELFSINLKNNYVAAVRDTVMGTWCCTKNKIADFYRKYLIKTLKLDGYFCYFNGGVLVYNMKALQSNSITSKHLFKVAVSRKWSWMDQDVLNFVCHGKVLYLDSKWNVMVQDIREMSDMDERIMPDWMFNNYLNALKSPSIIHYAGRQQPLYNYSARFTPLYWHYASKSPLYVDLLNERLRINYSNISKKSRFMMFARKMLPINTKRGRFARYIYHIFKK